MLHFLTVVKFVLIPAWRQSGPEESDFTRYILLTTVLSYLTLATFISAQRKSQPNLVEPAGRETNSVDCKAGFTSSVSLTAAFSHCGCFAIRRPVDYSTSVQRHIWTPYCVHECKDVNGAASNKDVYRMFLYIINLQVEYLPKCNMFRIFYLQVLSVRLWNTHQSTGLSPLSKDSQVLPKLDLTGLFHLASLVGPIKREQDEIKRGDSFCQRHPREYSLQ